ncbi:MAG: hypothetical protein ACMXYK_05290 [Candidatus Woesearchaeota archaeon]
MLVDNTKKIIKVIEKDAQEKIDAIHDELQRNKEIEKRKWDTLFQEESAKLKEIKRQESLLEKQRLASEKSIVEQQEKIRLQAHMYDSMLEEVKKAIKKNPSSFIEAALQKLPKKYDVLHIPIWATYTGAKNILPEDSFTIRILQGSNKEFEYSLNDMLEEHQKEIKSVLDSI